MKPSVDSVFEDRPAVGSIFLAE